MSQHLVVRGRIATNLPASGSLVNTSCDWDTAMVLLFSGVTKRKVTWRRASSPSPSYVVDTALAILQPLYGNAFTMGGPPLGQPGRLFRSVRLDSSRGVVKTVICLFIPAAVTLPPEAFQASLPPSVDAIIKSHSIWRFPL